MRLTLYNWKQMSYSHDDGDSIELTRSSASATFLVPPTAENVHRLVWKKSKDTCHSDALKLCNELLPNMAFYNVEIYFRMFEKICLKTYFVLCVWFKDRLKRCSCFLTAYPEFRFWILPTTGNIKLKIKQNQYPLHC